jgi:hypothetical protein
MNNLTLFRICAALTICALAQTTLAQQALELSGAQFAAEAQVNESKLLLHGAGIRHRFGIKVYAAGLYTAAKFTSVDTLLVDPRAKRLQLIFYREVDGNELGNLFIRGIQNNVPPNEEMSKIIQGASQMGDAMGAFFSGGKKLLPGDVLHIDYVPNVGTIVTHNGKPVGSLIREPRFFSALLRIWLGQDPADAQLKQALLGIAPPPGTEPVQRPKARS